MTGRVAAVAAVLLLAACSGKPVRQPPVVFPAAQQQKAMAEIDAFLPKAEREAAQCRGPDRRLLDTYLNGLRTLRQSPEGGAEAVHETVSLFEKVYAECQAKTSALEQRLAAIDARCQDTSTRLGMRAAQVLKSCWGAPDHVNQRKSGRHVLEEWVYPGVGQLYFKDGVLTAIHETGTDRRYLQRLGRTD